MWMEFYVREKLRELEAERASRSLLHARPASETKLTLRPLVRRAGRALRWMGERLESWGTSPAAQGDSGRRELRRGANG